MKLEYDGCSETGAVRKNNEDAILMRSDGNAGLFLVADGIGGRESGEVVSSAIRDRYDAWWHETFLPSRGSMSFLTALEDIRSTLLHLNRELVQRFGEMRSGSTLAFLFLLGENCTYFSSGDSRIYRPEKLTLQQITRDDVYTSKDGRDRAQNGRLTAAVGIRTDIAFNMRTDTVRSSDCFFLCSDGVYRYVKPPVLRRRILLGNAFSSPKRVVEKLRQDVVRNGSGDNYSMVFVRVSR